MSARPDHNPIEFVRLRVVLSAGQGSWRVPVDYYRLLRGAVYDLLSQGDPDLAGFLHEGGFSAESPVVDAPDIRQPAPPAGAELFKLFCHCGLIGKGVLDRGRLRFDEPVAWFFATPVARIGRVVEAVLRRNGRMRIGSAELKVTDLSRLAEPAVDKSLTCVLLSPLVITATPAAVRREAAGGVEGPGPGEGPAAVPEHRQYLTRDDGIVLTEARLRSNLLAKHRAVYGVEPDDTEFTFLWAAVSKVWPAPDRPTRLVRLSGPAEPPVQVRGTLGAITVAGSSELLRLALHVGLGQYNASGMGFVLPEAEGHYLPPYENSDE